MFHSYVQTSVTGLNSVVDIVCLFYPSDISVL